MHNQISWKKRGKMHGENISSVSSKIRKNCNFFCLLQICPNQQWNFEFKLLSFKLQRKQMIDDDLKNTYNALTSLFKSTVQTTFFAPGFKYTFLILPLLLDLATQPRYHYRWSLDPPSKYNLKRSKFLSEKYAKKGCILEQTRYPGIYL